MCAKIEATTKGWWVGKDTQLRAWRYGTPEAVLKKASDSVRGGWWECGVVCSVAEHDKHDPATRHSD